MSSWQQATKYLFDKLVAIIILFATSPFLGVIAVAIWLEDKGPVVLCPTKIRQRCSDIQHLQVSHYGSQCRCVAYQ